MVPVICTALQLLLLVLRYTIGEVDKTVNVSSYEGPYAAMGILALASMLLYGASTNAAKRDHAFTVAVHAMMNCFGLVICGAGATYVPLSHSGLRITFGLMILAAAQPLATLAAFITSIRTYAPPAKAAAIQSEIWRAQVLVGLRSAAELSTLAIRAFPEKQGLWLLWVVEVVAIGLYYVGTPKIRGAARNNARSFAERVVVHLTTPTVWGASALTLCANAGYVYWGLDSVIAEAMIAANLCLRVGLSFCSLLINSSVNDERAIFEKETVLVKEKLRLQVEVNQQRQKQLRYVCHELRVPLNSIVLGLQALLEEGESVPQGNKFDPETHESLTLMSAAAHSMMATLSDLLDLAKAEAGAFNISLKPMSLQKLVRSAAMQILPFASADTVQIKVEVHPDVPRWVLGDPIRLSQALLNFASNAIKFVDHSGKGRVSIHVEIEPRLVLVNGRLKRPAVSPCKRCGLRVDDCQCTTPPPPPMPLTSHAAAELDGASATGAGSHTVRFGTIDDGVSSESNSAAGGGARGGAAVAGTEGGLLSDFASPAVVIEPHFASLIAAQHQQLHQQGGKGAQQQQRLGHANDWDGSAVRSGSGSSSAASGDAGSSSSSSNSGKASGSATASSPKHARAFSLRKSVSMAAGSTVAAAGNAASSIAGKPPALLPYTVKSPPVGDRPAYEAGMASPPAAASPTPVAGSAAGGRSPLTNVAATSTAAGASGLSSSASASGLGSPTPGVDEASNTTSKAAPEDALLTLPRPAGEVYHVDGGSFVTTGKVVVVRITCRDNGVGIDRPALNTLYRAFMQLEAGQSYKGRSSGLGLAIVREIVAKHGGRVGVASQQGAGSDFFMSVPFHVVEPLDLEDTISSSASGAGGSAHGGRSETGSNKAGMGFKPERDSEQSQSSATPHYSQQQQDVMSEPRQSSASGGVNSRNTEMALVGAGGGGDNPYRSADRSSSNSWTLDGVGLAAEMGFGSPASSVRPLLNQDHNGSSDGFRQMVNQDALQISGIQPPILRSEDGLSLQSGLFTSLQLQQLALYASGIGLRGQGGLSEGTASSAGAASPTGSSLHGAGGSNGSGLKVYTGGSIVRGARFAQPPPPVQFPAPPQQQPQQPQRQSHSAFQPPQQAAGNGISASAASAISKGHGDRQAMLIRQQQQQQQVAGAGSGSSSSSSSFSGSGDGASGSGSFLGSAGSPQLRVSTSTGTSGGSSVNTATSGHMSSNSYSGGGLHGRTSASLRSSTASNASSGREPHSSGASSKSSAAAAAAFGHDVDNTITVTPSAFHVGRNASRSSLGAAGHMASSSPNHAAAGSASSASVIYRGSPLMTSAVDGTAGGGFVFDTGGSLWPDLSAGSLGRVHNSSSASAISGNSSGSGSLRGGTAALQLQQPGPYVILQQHGAPTPPPTAMLATPPGAIATAGLDRSPQFGGGPYMQQQQQQQQQQQHAGYYQGGDPAALPDRRSSLSGISVTVAGASGGLDGSDVSSISPPRGYAVLPSPGSPEAFHLATTAVSGAGGVFVQPQQQGMSIFAGPALGANSATIEATSTASGGVASGTGSTRGSGGLRILVVDDVKSNRFFLVMMLRRAFPGCII